MLIRYIPWVPVSLFTTIMLICYLFAMGAYEGGCPCAASATDALWGGGCPCAHALLRYLVNNQGGRPCDASATDALWGGGCPCAHVFSATCAKNGPKQFSKYFQTVPQQTGISRVLPPNHLSPHLWGRGVGG